MSEEHQEKVLALDREMRSRELDIKERELQHNSERAGFSVQAAIVAGALSLATAVVSNAVSGCWTQNLADRQHERETSQRKEESEGKLQQEKQSQEFQILLAATKDRSPEESAENLKFFIDIGYLSDPEHKIRNKAENKDLPVISSAAAESNSFNPILERARRLGDSAENFIIKEGLLMGPVPIQKHAAKANGQMAEPKVILFHFSASSGFDSLVKSLVDNGYGPHLCLGRNGEIAQIMPFDHWGSHAGKSSWNGMPNVSQISIGVEMENWGKLTRKGGKWLTWSGAELPLEEVVEIEGEGWHRFTEAQINAARVVTEALAKGYPSISAVIGHSDVSGGRKVDPGPAFPIQELRGLPVFQSRSDPSTD